MKGFLTGILAVGVVTGTAAVAKDQPDKQSVGQLKQALAAVATTAASQGPPPPEHFQPKADNDQGDDHASPTAILKVCSKDTPAAHRAAICPVGVSPD